jgi:small conductance mechanosensitive channel
MTPTPTTSTGFLRIDDPLVQALLNMIRGLAILVVALILAVFAKRWVIRALTRLGVNLNMATLLGNLAQVGVVVVGIITVLPAFGVDWAGLVAVLGAAGLALSLSMQDLLKNVIAGVYILIEQPFRIGDRISVKEVTGAVEGIELRTTILKTDDNLQVVVPNSMVLNEIVTNRSVSNLQRRIVHLRLPKGSMSEMSREITEALRGVPDIAATPAPVIALERVVEGVVRLRVEFWAPGPKLVEATAQAIEAIRSRLPDASATVE